MQFFYNGSLFTYNKKRTNKEQNKQRYKRDEEEEKMRKSNISYQPHTSIIEVNITQNLTEKTKHIIHTNNDYLLNV